MPNKTDLMEIAAVSVVGIALCAAVYTVVWLLITITSFLN